MLEQLSIFVENEIGSLSKVTSVLRSNEINIRAVSVFDAPEYSIMRMVVDRPEEGTELLREAGFAVKTSDVLAVELQDKPGTLDRVLSILAKEGLNLNYLYTFVYRPNALPLMVMCFDENDVAKQVLLNYNIVIREEV